MQVNLRTQKYENYPLYQNISKIIEFYMRLVRLSKQKRRSNELSFFTEIVFIDRIIEVKKILIMIKVVLKYNRE